MLLDRPRLIRVAGGIVSFAVTFFSFVYAVGNIWAASFRDVNYSNYLHRAYVLLAISVVFLAILIWLCRPLLRWFHRKN
jgi:hypothetical protein